MKRRRGINLHSSQTFAKTQVTVPQQVLDVKRFVARFFATCSLPGMLRFATEWAPKAGLARGRALWRDMRIVLCRKALPGGAKHVGGFGKDCDDAVKERVFS